MIEFDEVTRLSYPAHSFWKMVSHNPMAEKYRIQALVDGAWKTQSIFSGDDPYDDVRRVADQFIASDTYSEVRILEAYKREHSEKLAYRESYASSIDVADGETDQSQDREKPQPHLDEYEIQKKLTGEWVQVSEQEAKRHPLYGINGWLFFLAFSLIAGFIGEFISDDLLWKIFSSPMVIIVEPIVLIYVLPFISILFLVYVLPVWLLMRKSRFFQPVTITTLMILVLFSLFGIENYGDLFPLGLTIMWIGYVAVSERVNVTTRHRVRPAYLEKIWNQDYPAPQSLIGSADW